jgi:hypothetical protein
MLITGDIEPNKHKWLVGEDLQGDKTVSEVPNALKNGVYRQKSEHKNCGDTNQLGKHGRVCAFKVCRFFPEHLRF